MAIKTQGTRVYFKDTTATEPVVVMLECPTGITGLGGGTQDEIDITPLYADTRSFELGLKDGGEVSIPIIYDPASLSHKKMFVQHASGVGTEICIAMSNCVAAPTLDTNGNFIPPSVGTSLRFAALIKQPPMDIAGNEVVRTTMVVRVNGNTTIRHADGTETVY